MDSLIISAVKGKSKKFDGPKKFSIFSFSSEFFATLINSSLIRSLIHQIQCSSFNNLCINPSKGFGL